MAIIPLGPFTMPLIRKLLINRPGLPGGRFNSEGPPLVSLPSSGEKGSRRTIFSRTATGFIAGTAAEVSMPDLAEVTDVDLGEFAVGLAAALEGALVPEPTVGFMLLLAVPGRATETGFAELLTGLALAFDVAAPAGEVDPEAGAGSGTGGPGLLAEFVGAAGFGVWAGFGAAAGFATAAGLAGAGGFKALRTASGVAGTCCASRGIARAARQSTATQLVRFAFRMALYRSRIFSSILFISPLRRPMGGCLGASRRRSGRARGEKSSNGAGAADGGAGTHGIG